MGLLIAHNPRSHCRLPDFVEWDGCRNPLRADAEFSIDYKSMKRWPNRLFLDRLALPHMSTNFWMCCCGILFNFQGLRRTFPKSNLEFWIDVDHQIWGNTPIGWHKTNGPMGALPQTWRTNRSLAPNLMVMAKQRTCPAFFQLFAEITKLLLLFWQASIGVYKFYIT